MYSFAQRTDTHVLDEPYYSVYLDKSSADHPGKEEVFASLPKDELIVTDNIIKDKSAEVLFIKNMAHHIEVLGQPFIPGAINIFLIRHPRQIISSYTKVIENPVMRDIGVAYQYFLFNTLVKQGQAPVVVDSNLLLDNAESVIRKLCNACGIEFQQRMLHWPEGPKAYDGVWATHWYANVHRSTGFNKQLTPEMELPLRLHSLYSEAMTFYEKLLPFSLKA
jgi:hypothetical protein